MYFLTATLSWTGWEKADAYRELQGVAEKSSTDVQYESGSASSKRVSNGMYKNKSLYFSYILDNIHHSNFFSK